ncbi:MAG: bifunctional pyr operon transcriptional regulator/uracil phosphoribosyltransferase PyrR [Nitrosospira sp.]|nr:bifunctional pyr operon transcriptional regulator/uracil phosphoribosyltransferase PyrR [Nitrosospira sp.]MDW7642604.1 bifunctional pyr operon transcriptional regulator/uracil phosphoribosyltransferase PyrR [Nitrosomonadaceae bacterium]MBI0408260.1 bifunctional pyr operon transcriptional regulator/uracil phosphoribosyltransferase PyrR [Nitrosospira sp.]MBI0413978.1 bifunctional pyr operon transcriptional regulator/uracil phosphoribosyltransferase PyrR [Nitrosospira sp.]MBI0415647.1 bifunctio
MQLPNAEQLLVELTEKMRPDVATNIALVGIYTGGVWLAERLHQDLGITLPLGVLDSSFYRDDFDQIGLHSQVRSSNIPFKVDGSHIILIDDVLFTGRTIRAATNELFDHGRPASIRLAALIDRGGRELPIAINYVGTTIVLSEDKMLALERNKNGKLNLSLYDRVNRNSE